MILSVIKYRKKPDISLYLCSSFPYSPCDLYSLYLLLLLYSGIGCTGIIQAWGITMLVRVRGKICTKHTNNMDERGFVGVERVRREIKGMERETEERERSREWKRERKSMCTWDRQRERQRREYAVGHVYLL